MPEGEAPVRLGVEDGEARAVGRRWNGRLTLLPPLGSLELLVYIGRRWTMGHWDLPQHPLFNPFQYDTEKKKRDSIEKGILAGLKAQEKALQQQMNKLGAGMVKSIKRSLKIKSPSRVTRDEVGAASR